MRRISVVGDSLLFQFLSPLEEKREKRKRLLCWRSLFHQAPPSSVFRLSKYGNVSEDGEQRSEVGGKRWEKSLLSVILYSFGFLFLIEGRKEKRVAKLAIALPSSSSDFRSPTSVLRNEVGGRRKEMRRAFFDSDSLLFEFFLF